MFKSKRSYAILVFIIIVFTVSVLLGYHFFLNIAAENQIKTVLSLVFESPILEQGQWGKSVINSADSEEEFAEAKAVLTEAYAPYFTEKGLSQCFSNRIFTRAFVLSPNEPLVIQTCILTQLKQIGLSERWYSYKVIFQNQTVTSPLEGQIHLILENSHWKIDSWN